MIRNESSWLTILLFSFSSPSRLHPHGDSYDNAHLKSAVKLFQGEVNGPEGFTMDSKGNMYTGLSDGRVILFNDTNYSTLVRLGIDDDRCGNFLRIFSH